MYAREQVRLSGPLAKRFPVNFLPVKAKVKQLMGDRAASKEAARRTIIFWMTVSDLGLAQAEQLSDEPK